MALEFVSEILLPRLLAASVQSTLFVAVVWALCKLLPRLSASARAGLWWLVALQLVVGVLWSSPLALPLLPAEVVEQASAAPVQMTALSTATAETLASPMTKRIVLTSRHRQHRHWSWSAAFAWLWLLGLSFMIARTLRGYLATRRLLRDSRACKDRTLLHALQLAAEAHGLHRTPHLRLSASIDSPQLIGPWRPVLLLPADHPQSMHADELDMALTHELVHLQRHDLWWGLLPAVAQHLFFFHPLAHLAAREYALAREVACDAAVLAGNRHCARDYGRLLIRLGVAPRPSAGLASASPTFHILKRRLAHAAEHRFHAARRRAGHPRRGRRARGDAVSHHRSARRRNRDRATGAGGRHQAHAFRRAGCAGCAGRPRRSHAAPAPAPDAAAK